MSNKRDNTNKDYNFTLGLALVDIFPCLFFGIAMYAAGAWFGSIPFMLGAIICTLSGLVKVTWKLLIVFKNKDISIMNYQLRAMMPLGMLLMIASLIFADKDKINIGQIIAFAKQSPARIFLYIGLCCMLLMFVWAFALDSKKNISNWIEEITNAVAQAFIMIGILWLVYAGNYYSYEHSEWADAVDREVSVQSMVCDGYIAYEPTDKSAEFGFVFYPGGKVEATAYEPVLKLIANRGFVCVLVEMPDNLAVLNIDVASSLDFREKYSNVSNWYLGGHSLGGASASIYLYKLGEAAAEQYKGLVLLAAYSSKDISDLGIKVMSIYGSEDHVINADKYKKNLAYLPKDYTEIVISGGCHGYFGDYGMQDGDGVPNITPYEQWKITADSIVNFVINSTALGE